MKRHIASLAVAGLIVAFAFIVPMMLNTRSGVLEIVAWVAMWPIFPAFLIMMVFGPHQGPDGLPALTDAYILAFVLWWLAIDFGPRLFGDLDKDESGHDAVLYLGPRSEFTRSRLSPALCADAAYIRTRLERIAEAGPEEEADRLKEYCASLVPK